MLGWSKLKACQRRVRDSALAGDRRHRRLNNERQIPKYYDYGACYFADLLCRNTEEPSRCQDAHLDLRQTSRPYVEALKTMCSLKSETCLDAEDKTIHYVQGPVLRVSDWTVHGPEMIAVFAQTIAVVRNVLPKQLPKQNVLKQKTTSI